MIPGPDKQFKGQFPGNYSGNLWASQNIDLERYGGRITLADKMLRFASALGIVHKFIRTNATTTDQWFGIVLPTTSSATDGDLISNGSSVINGGTWAADATTNTFNDPHDFVVHELAVGEQRLICTRASDIAILNSSGANNIWDADWMTTVLTGGSGGLSNTVFHPIGKLQRLVVVGDKVSGVPVIHTIDKDNVLTLSRLSFGAEYTAKWIITTSNRFWIGLTNDLGNKAKIIEWDGYSLTYNNEYDLIGPTPLVGFVVDGIPFVITDFGYVYKYSGGSFQVFQDFGLRENHLIFDTAAITNYGAYVDRHLVYLNILMPVVSSVSATVMPNGTRRWRSGVHVLNTQNKNLYHSMGFGEHATAGTDINYASHCSAVGAITKLQTGDVTVASAGVYIGGATWQASAVTGIYEQVRSGNQTSNAGRNRGYFITPYIPIQDVEGFWQALWVKFKKFVNSNNRIIVRWRTSEPLFNASAVD